MSPNNFSSRFKTFLTFCCIAALGFAFVGSDNIPNGWRKMGSQHDKYEMGIDNSIFKTGNQSGFIKSKEEKIKGFGALQQSVIADEYWGKRIKFSGYIKTENVAKWAGLWLRIDDIYSSKHLDFDNMHDRDIKGTTDWTPYEITMDVPSQASSLTYGAILNGTGQIWIDDLKIEIIGDSQLKEDAKNELSPPTNLDFEDK